MQKSITLTTSHIATLQNANVTNSHINMKELVARFSQFVDVSALSLKGYNSGIRKFLAYLSENGITAPTRETVLSYKKALCEKYAANSVALYLSALRRFFAWCESEGLYTNITAGVKSPKISHEHKRDAFGASELKEIISGINRDGVEGKRNYAIFTLIASCGLRCIEVVRANVGDIHRVAGVTVLDVQGKGHAAKDAIVKLSGHVVRAIEEYLQARGSVSENAPLFASCSKRNKGARLTTQTISQVCKRSMIAAGYNSRRLTAHSLRHSAITISLLAGNSLDDVSAFARHSSIAVTQVYNHAISRMKSRCESSIASAIFGA